MVTARGCLIYNDTQSDKAVAAIDFGGDKTSTEEIYYSVSALLRLAN